MLSVKGFLLSLNGGNDPDTISCYFHLATATHIGLGRVGQQDERDYEWVGLHFHIFLGHLLCEGLFTNIINLGRYAIISNKQILISNIHPYINKKFSN